MRKVAGKVSNGKEDKRYQLSDSRCAVSNKFRRSKKNKSFIDKRKATLPPRASGYRGRARKKISVAAELHRHIEAENEDRNAGTDALNTGSELGEHFVGGRGAKRYGQKLKQICGVRKELGRAGSKQGHCSEESCHGRTFTGGYADKTKNEPGKTLIKGADTSGVGTKAYQKEIVKKEAQRSARRRYEKELGGNAFEGVRRKLTSGAEDIWEKVREWFIEHIQENPALFFVLLSVMVIFPLLIGSAGSSNLLANLLSGSGVISSYTAEDAAILAANERYTALERELNERVQNIENAYPGYDEYRYSLAETGHNPYALAALLTVLDEDYTQEEVQDRLSQIFDLQYTVSLTPEVELRTRTEQRTGTRTVRNPDGTTDTEEYEYEVEVQYEYKILTITVTNRALDEAFAEAHLNEEQLERYRLLMETKGNKEYLFAEDIYTDSGVNPGIGSTVGMADGPTGEALTDSEFAAMWQEASKYLGRRYVWGGSDPHTGFDCSGFVCWVINHSGVGNVGRTTAEGLRQKCRTVSRENREPGDLIFFQGTYRTSGASHVGIYIGEGKMIHCGDPIKISGVDSGYFAQHFLSYGRLK